MKTPPPLKEADALDKKARQIYFGYITERVLECGSIAKLAERCDIPASSIYSALSRKGGRSLRQMAHSIRRRSYWKE